VKQYVALDCSLKQISVCVMTEQRRIVREAVIAADAGSIGEFVWSQAPEAELIGLESGPSSSWLFHALRAEGLPVVVIDARHARAVLSLRINKTDRNDAVGLAELLVSGWYKPVTVKSLESHRVRTVLTNRALLVGIRQDLENQVRSVLKTFGFVPWQGSRQLGGSGERDPFERAVAERRQGSPWRSRRRTYWGRLTICQNCSLSRQRRERSTSLA